MGLTFPGFCITYHSRAVNKLGLGGLDNHCMHVHGKFLPVVAYSSYIQLCDLNSENVLPRE